MPTITLESKYNQPVYVELPYLPETVELNPGEIRHIEHNTFETQVRILVSNKHYLWTLSTAHLTIDAAEVRCMGADNTEIRPTQVVPSSCVTTTSFC